MIKKNYNILMMILHTWLLVPCPVSSICDFQGILGDNLWWSVVYFFGVLTLLQPPLSVTSVFAISYISYNPSWQLPENRCWFFSPIGTKLNNVSSCVPFKIQHVCYSTIISLMRMEKYQYPPLILLILPDITLRHDTRSGLVLLMFKYFIL